MAVILIGLRGHSPTDIDRLKHRAAVWQMEAFLKALDRYRADCRGYPDEHDGLEALVSDPGVPGWAGTYISQIPLDPWGRSYVYRAGAGAIPPEILSYGADGKPGGEYFDADISGLKPGFTIGPSPYDVRARRIRLAVWVGAWVFLAGSCFLLCWTTRKVKSCEATEARPSKH
ncbi:MAG: type II secretion system protein GspG [Bryobacteraceae bacterium]